MKAKSTLLSFSLALMAFLNTAAQVVADFTIDNTSGCSPLSVNFTNASTGSGTLTYSWDLGNGNTSTLKDPKAIYSNAGNYTIKLTVTNGTLTHSVSKSIVVYKNPTANFTPASAKGCVPINVTFKDASVKGDAVITKWNWDFRNGILSTEQNPTNSYTNQGKYDVFLEVTDANGCKSSLEKKALVDVANKPMVSFYATPSTSCTVPANIQFNNQSTGLGTLSYAWDFGSGATSVIKNPKQTYNSFGTYNVKLTVTSDYGCSSTLDVPSVVLGEVNAIGELKQNSTSIKDKSIICSGDIDYNNLSAGNSNCFWDFGDGSSSYSSSGKHNYPNAGTFKIKLIAAPGDACADTVIWNITVEKAVAGFTLSPEQSCSSSTVVSFNNQSSNNIVSNKWTFHDESVLTDKNVVKNFVEPKDKDQYVVHQQSSYPVKLNVVSNNGCKDSLEKVFTVNRPTALFAVSTVQGCVPLEVNFNDISISDDPVKERKWIFGEGADQVVTTTTATHTYNSAGTYEMKFIVTTEKGCKDTSYSILIKAGNKVTPDFSANNTTVCSSQILKFTDLSPVGASKWHYVVGGKGVPTCADVQNPSVYLKTDTGKLAVKMFVENNGCLSEIEKADALKNDGPVGSFSSNTSCTAIRTVNFKGIAKKSSSFKWDFGDSQTNTTDLQTSHQYAAEGDYTVKFIVFNGFCSDTVIRTLKVRDHQPQFKAKAEACAGDMIYFNSKLSHKTFNSCTERYLWNFGDSTQMMLTHKDSISHSFSNGGTFTVKLFAFYEDGCVDSINKPIRIYKPIPLFTVNRTEGCSPLPVTFTDKSTPDVHPINFWSWNFGDGNAFSYTTKLNSIDNTFELPGEYNAVLSVADDFGCTATFEKKISTALPTATFSAVTPTQICAGTEVRFFMDFPNPDSAIWNFGNGNVIRSVAQPTAYSYADTGSFDVTLKVYKFGCSDVFTYPKYVQVQKANARFNASDTAYNCYPRLIHLIHSSGSKNILTGKWYYGHNNNTSAEYVDTTSYNYTETGLFRAKLEVQTTFGCTDTFSRQIKITGPIGHFEVTPKEACQGDLITYTITDTSHVQSFEWDLGDGNLMSGNPVIHRYSSVGNKTAKLLLHGEKECRPPAIEQTIHIYEVVSGIDVQDTSVCEGTSFEFKNTSTGATTYNWDFGDGAQSIEQSPTHLFSPGIYKVALMSLGLQGCRDTAIQYVIVGKYPTLNISKDTSICFGGTATLRANSDKKLTWSPITYLDLSNINSPFSSAPQSITYQVFATDTVSQCFRKDSIQLTVQQKPEVQLDVEATNILAGRPIQLTANTEEGATFVWTPAEFLSCNNCFNPISTVRSNTTFLVKVTDKNKCFTTEKSVDLIVGEGDKAFDVPSAFTPSGSEPNNVFLVRGYNIKQLLEFNIYNRWGNLVFTSTDLSKGWDGFYQGKAQPVDSYVYTIKIETFEGKIETKTGTILLLR